MRPLHFVLIAALLTPAAALAQDRQRVPPKSDTSGDGSGRGGDGQRTAVPREAPPPPPPQRSAPPPQQTAPPPQRSEPAPQRSAPPATSATAPDSGSSGAQERQRIPPEARRDGDRRGEQQPRGGTAIPRPRGVPPRTGGDSRVYVPGPRVYNNYYYYYPRRYYPYGYGAFGLGYFYYDPYSWGPAYGYDPYYPPFRGYGYGYPTGELRLQVRPRDAEVYVDGYYAGRVDDFDGVFQSLTLEEGGYRIEIVAPGFEPLVFDVRVFPGRTVTYRGDLLRRRP